MKLVFSIILTAILITSCKKDDAVTPQEKVAVGDSYAGGIVFYVDATGHHGLVSATTDQTTTAGIAWDSKTYGIPYQPPATGATGTAIGTGAANTAAIFSITGAGNNAVTLCKNYQGGGFNDWYLPSKDELNLLWLHRKEIGGFTDKTYWSSSEVDNRTVWSQHFYTTGVGYQASDLAKVSMERVRSIRSF